MATVTQYPTVAPPEAPPIQRKTGLWRCMACRGHLHASCPGAVKDARPKQRLWICYCCGHKNPRCLTCGATEDINTELWICNDVTICEGRVMLRLSNTPLWNLLQQCKVAAVNTRRRQREQTARIWRGVPRDEEDMLEQERKATTNRRPKTGQCTCCGGTTRGGEFLPGHDAKYKSVLRKTVKEGGEGATAAAAELEKRGW